MKLSRIIAEHETGHSFVGRYKAHGLRVARSLQGDPWDYMVTRQDGSLLDSGKLDSELPKREALYAALRSAGLLKTEHANDSK